MVVFPSRRGITPVFGYTAPHPSGRGTSTLRIKTLPSTHYEPVRHPGRPGVSLAGVQLGVTRSHRRGLPVLHQFPVCRHAVTNTPVGPLDRIVQNEGVSAPRHSPATTAFPVYMAGRLPR
jgi:hypothetical protein